MPVRNDYVVKAHTVRKGDIIDREGVESNADAIKSGPKWTEVRDADGKLILRIPNETDVLISRVESTEEEREAQRRARRNESIVNWLDDYQLAWDAAQAKFSEEIKGGYEVDRYNFAYSRLAHAQAEHSIKSAIIAAKHGMQKQADQKHRDTGEPKHVVDWVEAFEVWRDRALEDLIDRFRGDSRSTSQISNVLEDIQHETVAKIAGRRRFNPLDY